MAESVEKRAMAKVKDFFQRNGWDVIDVSRLSEEHAGYDLLVAKDFKKSRVEVKGSSAPYRGIPDLYGTSVDKDRRLVPEILCIAYFPEGGQEKLAIMLRDDFPPDALIPKSSYCIKNEHKSPAKIGNRLVDIDGPCPEYVLNAAIS